MAKTGNVSNESKATKAHPSEGIQIYLKINTGLKRKNRRQGTHLSDPSFIPGTTFGPPSTARRKPQAQQDMVPKQKTKIKKIK